MQDGSLDPRKNVHLRPSNNPFSIFSGSGVGATDDVPDIFADTPAPPSQRKAAAPVLVPSLRAEDGFSLLPPVNATGPTTPMVTPPAGGSKSYQQQTPVGKSATVANVPLPPPPVTFKPAPAVVVQQPPPPPPPVDDDSFFDEDDDGVLSPRAAVVSVASGAQVAQRLAAEKRRVAELELRLAQQNMELVGLRDRLKAKDEELAQLQGTLAQAKRKEREDNKALEAALG